MNTCQNCQCEVPENHWCCDRCFALFDGEDFIELPEGFEVQQIGPDEVQSILESWND